MVKQLKRLQFLREGGITLAVLVGIEFLAIVLAVMLGFIANDWRENRQKAAEIDQAMRSLAAELAYNHEQIEWQYVYRRNMLDAIAALTESGSVTSIHDLQAFSDTYGPELEGWRGAMPPMLRSSTYQMMLNTGLMSAIPFEMADQIAFIYNMQTLVDRGDDAFIRNVIEEVGFLNVPRIYHTFSLYNETLPLVMASYQEIARPMLADYGYDLEVEDEGLSEVVYYQRLWIAGPQGEQAGVEAVTQ